MEAGAWPGSFAWVVLGLPHRRLIATAARRAGARDLGLLPDAQSCPSDRDAGGQEWAAQDLGEAHRRYTGAINARFG
jgi:hypothetical protein